MKIEINILNIDTLTQLHRIGGCIESTIIDLLNEHYAKHKVCSCGRELMTDMEKEANHCMYCLGEANAMQRDIHDTQESLRNL